MDQDAPEPIQRRATEAGPECYVRIAITKQSKGYVYESTVSLKWHDLVYPSKDGDVTAMYVRRPDAWGFAQIDEPANLAIRNLLQMADAEARAEIARREAADAECAKAS